MSQEATFAGVFLPFKYPFQKNTTATEPDGIPYTDKSTEHDGIAITDEGGTILP